MVKMQDYDVVIVGAGIAGLTSSYQLSSMAPDLRLLVLEAKDRVGGRTLTTDLRASNGTDRWDLGGQWVSTTQPHVMDLLMELGLDTYPQFVTGIKLLQLSDGAIREYKGSIPRLPLFALLDLRWFAYKVDKLCKELDVNEPNIHPRATELNGTTVETYMNENLFTKETKDVLLVAIRTTLGCDPCDVSILYMLMYAKSAGGLMQLFEATHGGAQERRIKGGAQQISECLMEKIGRNNVRLLNPVKSIHQNSDVGNSILEITTEVGETITAKYVILAIPLQLAAHIDFQPALPEKRKVLFSSMPMGHLTKYICTYENAFWRTKGFSGEIVSSGGERMATDCDAGPLGVVYDATTYKGSPALVGFLGGDQGIQWTSKPFEMRKFAILKALSQCFGEEALNPIDFAEKIWSDEPYTGGCPVNFAPPGVMQHMSNNFRNPFGRIHWAGTETATSWCGYMNGAVQSGRRAAKEVLFHLKPGHLASADLHDTFYRSRQAETPTTFSSFGFLHTLIAAVLGGVVFFLMIREVK